MNNLRGFRLAALLMLISVSSVSAELNSAQRVRAFSKLPNWSGLWEQFETGATGAPDDPAELKRMVESFGLHPPYNAEWEAKSQALKAARANKPDKPFGCIVGFPAMMIGSPYIFEAMVTPEETALIFSGRSTRHIYTDGRAHPPPDEIFATPWGDSVGHWEGQTLVVDTVATNWYATWDRETLSEQARFTERIRMLDKNTLEDQITVEDPIALSRPWKLTRQYHRVPNMNRLYDEVCEENDRNPVVNGKFTLAPPKP